MIRPVFVPTGVLFAGTLFEHPREGGVALPRPWPLAGLLAPGVLARLAVMAVPLGCYPGILTRVGASGLLAMAQ